MYLRLLRLGTLAALLVMLAIVVSVTVTPATAAAAFTAERYLVQAKSPAAYTALRTSLVQRGAKIAVQMPQIDTLVVYSAAGLSKTQIEQDSNVAHVARDHREVLTPPSSKQDLLNRAASNKATLHKLQFPSIGGSVATADPAFGLPGLMWSVERILAPQAWTLPGGGGVEPVTVAVADTGLDYTHIELAPKVSHVEDFSVRDEVPYEICSFFFGLPTDADLHDMFGGPANTDWNGHGSWIGGNIAAALNATGTNGIAFNVNLVALKISQNCGSAWDSTILDSFLWAADNHVNIVSISFGGYLDRADPEQNTIWQQYQKAVNYAKLKGTIIVAAAGNEHVRIGAQGQVISHGPLTTPGAGFNDLFGAFEVPGGIPGVVDVSSTGNKVMPPSASCPDGTGGSPSNLNATCKPTSDKHQSFGVGKKNQLSYFSNYGPRIDVAGPGGARKFNLPYWDRGGTPGYPYTTADGTTAFEDFSITSNWATEIDCFTTSGGNPGKDNLSSSIFPADNCFATIQGTSMATPHASATLAVISSARPDLRHIPNALIAVLKRGALQVMGNKTPPLLRFDTSRSDLTKVPCPTGYCHLGGGAIGDADAYGAGLVDVFDSIK